MDGGVHENGFYSELERSMSETEFLERVDQTLDRIEAAIEAAVDAGDSDIELSRSGGMLTLEFDNGSKIVINSQAAMHELWVAAKAGGFHFRLDGNTWRNTRNTHDGNDTNELFAALSRFASAQAGTSVTLHP